MVEKRSLVKRRYLDGEYQRNRREFDAMKLCGGEGINIRLQNGDRPFSRIFFPPTSRLLYMHQHFGFLPEFFEIVIFPAFGGENVGDDRTDIHQYPTAFRAALHPGVRVKILVGGFDDRVGQCPQHPVRRTRTDDEIIRKGAMPLDIQ
jgi:hypothetical protein